MGRDFRLLLLVALDLIREHFRLKICAVLSHGDKCLVFNH